MKIPFTKMHGLGNDYIYVNCFETPIAPDQFVSLARAMSDRHRGIGSDGLILICPPEPGVAADVRMQMFNSDGSRGQMCGNGIRCVAKYVLDRNMFGSSASEARNLRVQTDRGVL
jgi:diaminopimelate epimerase